MFGCRRVRPGRTALDHRNGRSQVRRPDRRSESGRTGTEDAQVEWITHQMATPVCARQGRIVADNAFADA